MQSGDAIATQRQDLDRLRRIAFTIRCSAVEAERGLRIGAGLEQPERARARWTPRRGEEVAQGCPSGSLVKGNRAAASSAGLPDGGSALPERTLRATAQQLCACWRAWGESSVFDGVEFSKLLGDALVATAVAQPTADDAAVIEAYRRATDALTQILHLIADAGLDFEAIAAARTALAQREASLMQHQRHKIGEAPVGGNPVATSWSRLGRSESNSRARSVLVLAVSRRRYPALEVPGQSAARPAHVSRPSRTELVMGESRKTTR